MAEAWRDLLRGFDRADPPLDLRQRVQGREARLQTRPRGWRVPRAAGWAMAAMGVAAVVAALALAAHSRRSEPASGLPAVVASPKKLAVLRKSFILGSGWSPYPGAASLPFPIPQLNSPLASSRNLDSVWATRRAVVVIWKSGIVETVEPWHCNCTLASFFSRFPTGFKRYTIGGSPAIAHSSDPTAFNKEQPLGVLRLAERTYGVPASVVTVRGGFKVTLWAYGADTLPGLIEVARTLPTQQEFAPIIDDPHAVITGGTRAQRRLLRSIMRGIDTNDVPKVEIASPPAPYDAKGGAWLTFRMSGLQERLSVRDLGDMAGCRRVS